MNDLITGKVKLAEVSLIVFDEAHRAVGDYAYVFIAGQYVRESSGLILGLTASPGSTKEAIEEVCRNLGIQHVEVRSITSPDVKPYVGGIQVIWRRVPLPPIFSAVRKHFEEFVRNQLKEARDYGYVESASAERVRLRDVLDAATKVRGEFSSDAPKQILGRILVGLYASVHALRAIELLETQGFAALKQYMDNLRDRSKTRMSASARIVLQDASMMRALALVDLQAQAGQEHPKVQVLTEEVNRAFRENARRIIVFTNYRTTAEKLVEVLNSIKGISAVRLVGQATKGRDRGLSQREQTLLLEDFKAGQYNVLVATQVGEEGLDIVECDEVVFYDTVPSAIRYIQRRGRTGRKGPGRATVLIAEGTRDEAYYWIAKRREQRMVTALKQVLREGKENEIDQMKIERFLEKEEMPTSESLEIVVDSRDISSPTARELVSLGVAVKQETLELGDFILSDAVVVERKTVDDFAASIIDGRLFNQVAELKEAVSKPLIVIEGETLQPSRDIRPEAMMGAIASVLVDFGVPLVWTKTPAETAQLMVAITRRERAAGRRILRVRPERKPTSLAQEQEFVVAGLPSVDTVLAKRLLKAFGSVERVFVAAEKELQDVEGIGGKISQRIRRVISEKYKPDES
jgi:Fanconi anemia group M protein